MIEKLKRLIDHALKWFRVTKELQAKIRTAETMIDEALEELDA